MQEQIKHQAILRIASDGYCLIKSLENNNHQRRGEYGKDLAEKLPCRCAGGH